MLSEGHVLLSAYILKGRPKTTRIGCTHYGGRFVTGCLGNDAINWLQKADARGNPLGIELLLLLLEDVRISEDLDEKTDQKTDSMSRTRKS